MSSEIIESLYKRVAALEASVSELTKKRERRAAAEIDVADETKQELLDSMIRLALSGNPTMQIWLSKNWLGYKDYGATAGPLPVKPIDTRQV